MQEKLNALSLGEKLVVGGGALMLIASFLPWYKIDFGLDEVFSASISRNGWQSPGGLWSLLAILISVALAASIVAVKFGNVKLPSLSNGITWGMVYGGGGVAVVVLVLLKLVNESSYMSIGFYLGIVAALIVAAGGYLLYSEEKKGVTPTV